MLVNKDGYRFLQDYDLGTPRPTPGTARDDGARPARPASPRRSCTRSEKGRTIEAPYGEVRAPRHAPPGREDHRRASCRSCASCAEVRQASTRSRADSGAPGRALHDGRRPHRHRTARRRSPGLYAAGECACVSINGANRLGSNSLPEMPGLRRAAGTRRRRARRWPRRHRQPGRRRGAGRDDAGAHRARLARHEADGSETHRRACATRCSRRWRTAPGIYRTGDGAAKARRRARASCGSASAAHRRSTTPAAPSTPSWSAALELGYMLDVRRGDRRVGAAREESRGAHQRTDFPARDDERVPGALAGVRSDGDGARRGRVPAGDDHPLAAGRAGLREVVMAITEPSTRPSPCEVDPLSAGAGRPRPPCGRTTYRCARSGRCSTGSTTSRTEIDATLSYRWSCRMGICGSCGMNVNGEPKLTCAAFLADYAPGPVRVEPLRELPGDPRPGRRHRRLHARSCPRQAVDHPRARRSRSDDGEYLQTPEAARRLQAVQHVHQLHALLRRLPGVRAGPRVPRAGGDRAGRSATTSTRATRARASGSTCSSSTRVSGAARSSASAREVCPKHVDPAGAIQRYKLKAANENLMAFLLPRGAR